MQYTNLKLTQRRTVLLCIAFFLAFLLLTLFRPSFHSLDAAANLWIPSLQSGTWTFFAQAIAILFDTPGLVLLSIVISGALFLKNHKPEALFLLGAMGGDALIVATIKVLGEVTRPTNAIAQGNGFAYPSGHSAGIIVFAGILAYFAWCHWQSTRSRVGIGAGLGVLVGVVGFDRVYLNVHWFSDVFGGWLFGAFWLSFVILLFRWLESKGSFQEPRFNTRANWAFAVGIVVAVLVALSGYIV